MPKELHPCNDRHCLALHLQNCLYAWYDLNIFPYKNHSESCLAYEKLKIINQKHMLKFFWK